MQKKFVVPFWEESITSSLEKYKPFACESDQQFYQKIIEKLRKLPRGNGDNKDCRCELICESAHTDFKTEKSQLDYVSQNFLIKGAETTET